MLTRRSEQRARKLFPTRADLLYEAEGQRILAQLSRRQSRVANREGDDRRACKLSELARHHDEEARFYDLLARTSK